ncbi:YcnI family protein [Streptomyces sp. NPDC088923]|uniref:YcnI family copper-binding membrane protein n=1 Tax=Streptomyces sp. NPDC088923 TaxID=3365913 RepID=UPI00382A6A94
MHASYDETYAPTASPTGRRRGTRLAVLGALAASGVLVLAGPAAAHVTVAPQGAAAKGGYATVNFKVPNERDDASTVKLEVNLPTDHPLASAQPQPVPGWTVKVTEAKLDKPVEMHGEKVTEAPSKITWTADGKGVEPGQFQQFPLSLGPLPEDADQLVFKALQTYSNKEVVRWIEEPKSDGSEPDDPAPVLTLSAAADDAHGSAANGSASDSGAAEGGDESGHDKTATASSDSDSDSSDTTARVLAVVGIVVGAAGVAFGVLAGRRRTATSD